MPLDAIAAIDLGSNSFHLLIARFQDGQLQIIDRLREMVQLAAGLDDQHRLSKEAQKRALACLSKFGQRLRHMPASRVRVVGTNTLRQARNGEEFLLKAEEALGHSVEIISGIEEARLIYQGVTQTMVNGGERRFVMDIGGGSTELIIGENFEPLHLESLFMGCVSMTRRAFSPERIREVDLKAAELAVQMEVEPVAVTYRELGWKFATGASGSIKSVRDVILQEGWSRDHITLESLRRLREAILELKTPRAMAERWGLEDARSQVFTGGFTVLYGVCEALQIETMEVADGALREGVVFDLLGRIQHKDPRERTIEALVRRYHMDPGQAERVSQTALNLLSQVAETWDLQSDSHVHDLQWAGRLHEVGLAIAHNQYHKHGAYLVHYSDLSGFSRSEQQFIAALIRGHRRKFPLAVFDSLPRALRQPAKRLCVLLRLAAVVHRSRSRQDLPQLTLKVKGKRLNLGFPEGWLDAHPLTRVDLETEADYLKAGDFKLSFE